MTDKYSLCSEALVMVGAAPISSFAGGSAEQIVASTLYEPTVLAIVSMRRWRCMSLQAVLSREAAVPSARWDASYQLPADCENIHGATVNGCLIEFDRYENRLLCDAAETDTVILDYTYRAVEAYWPAYFTNVVRLKLAASFAVPIAEDTEKASVYEGMFIRELGLAKNAEGQGRTAPKLPVGALRRYHRGRP